MRRRGYELFASLFRWTNCFQSSEMFWRHSTPGDLDPSGELAAEQAVPGIGRRGFRFQRPSRAAAMKRQPCSRSLKTDILLFSGGVLA